jgi:anti-sigma regulatory factor (Ser/Thr protein kinase)
VDAQQAATVELPGTRGALQQRGGSAIADGLTLVVAARADALSGVRAALRELLAQPPPASATVVADVELAVTEALANVAVHAYNREDGHADLAATRKNGALYVSVRDYGGGMQAAVDSPGLGIGLALMTTLTDSLRVNARDPGTEVEMTFTLAR